MYIGAFCFKIFRSTSTDTRPFGKHYIFGHHGDKFCTSTFIASGSLGTVAICQFGLHSARLAYPPFETFISLAFHLHRRLRKLGALRWQSCSRNITNVRYQRIPKFRRGNKIACLVAKHRARSAPILACLVSVFFAAMTAINLAAASFYVRCAGMPHHRLVSHRDGITEDSFGLGKRLGIATISHTADLS